MLRRRNLLHSDKSEGYIELTNKIGVGLVTSHIQRSISLNGGNLVVAAIYKDDYNVSFASGWNVLPKILVNSGSRYNSYITIAYKYTNEDSEVIDATCDSGYDIYLMAFVFKTNYTKVEKYGDYVENISRTVTSSNPILLNKDKNIPVLWFGASYSPPGKCTIIGTPSNQNIIVPKNSSTTRDECWGIYDNTESIEIKVYGNDTSTAKVGYGGISIQ